MRTLKGAPSVRLSEFSSTIFLELVIHARIYGAGDSKKLESLLAVVLFQIGIRVAFFRNARPVAAFLPAINGNGVGGATGEGVELKLLIGVAHLHHLIVGVFIFGDGNLILIDGVKPGIYGYAAFAGRFVGAEKRRFILPAPVEQLAFLKLIVRYGNIVIISLVEPPIYGYQFGVILRQGSAAYGSNKGSRKNEGFFHWGMILRNDGNYSAKILQKFWALQELG